MIEIITSIVTITVNSHREGVGILGFADLANFWFGFSVFAFKSCGFSVLVSRAVCGFSPIWSLVFGFCQQGWWFFWIFLPNAFYCFLVLPRKLHPAVAPKL